MGGAPVIETIRPGVQFTPAAAASFRRAEASWGRQIRCNSTYRDYGLQLSMYQAWTAWTEGRGPKPNHSRAIHPDYSIHCRGEALDTPDWTVPGFIAHMADHGWIRTAAGDPTEQHHFEYQYWRDNHRYEPAPSGEEDDMFSDQDRADLKAARKDASLAAAAVFGTPAIGAAGPLRWKNADGSAQSVNYGILPITIHNQTLIAQMIGREAARDALLEQLLKKVEQVSGSPVELDLAAIEARIDESVREALGSLVLVAHKPGTPEALAVDAGAEVLVAEVID